jgi:hypothetical protein
VLHLDKMAILASRDIKCDYPYLIGEESAKKRLNIIDNSTNQPSLVVEFINNRYFLSSNFINYAALKTLNDRKLVFCLVIEFKEVSEEKRLYRVLSKAFLERGVPWKFRYELVSRLRNEFLLNEEQLVEETGIPKSEIKRYILEQEIPDFFKSLAIEKGYGGPLLNSICRDKYFSNTEKEILYSLALKDKPRLTPEKFATLKRYISKGFYLSSNSFNLTEQIIKIVQPKDFIETIYWNYISQQYSKYFNDFNDSPQHPLQ